MTNRAIFAYVPVLHEGYRRFFEKWVNEGVDTLVLMGPSLIGEFDHLQRKDPRALEPDIAAKVIFSGLDMFRKVRVLDHQSEDMEWFRRTKPTLIVPREDEMLELVSRHFSDHELIVDDVFLRWDKSRSLAQNHLELDGHHVVTADAFAVELMQRAYKEAEMASDWYRQVGALVFKEGEVIAVGHNTHLPSPHTPYALGSPRGFFKKGLHVDLTTDEHAEPQIIGPLAAQGISLKGAWLFVTTFPCPPCAKFIGGCGFARVYFSEGYAMLDGESILRQRGVGLYRVQMPQID